MEQTIAAAVAELRDRLIAIRRDLHAHPEIGRAEHRTTDRIGSLLAEAGLDFRVLAVGTGGICDLEPIDDAPVIGLRADIDALPISDGKRTPYASTVPGACHACGHDVHTTVLLGTALVLARLRRDGLLPGGVRLIFQPAEETTPGGALDAIAYGACKDLSEVYALHCDPRTDVGQVGLSPGPITSAVDKVHVTLTGSGGHTSRPHLTADLVGAIGALATQAPLLLSRRIDPRGGVSLVWGRIHAGSAANAIPQSGQIEGTLRALQLAAWQEAEGLLPALLAQIVEPYGVSSEIVISQGVPPTVNHTEQVSRMAAVARIMLGPDSVQPTEQSLGGEDFAWMLREVPGALARLGVRPVGVGRVPDIHTPLFDVDEACIGAGVKLLTGLAAGVAR
ncbi:amidohydrolase [Microlunatus parietis]|uniref:Amidohydrolase n=1 Tax=Microlunatus parietis TaxID=682979 RepID=A0A7Y9LEB7_9ACTN|nr:amidohydrolase [Microlunatus parietis]NYE73725.1 amidohydrolase [Microlunatus parietis]